MDYISIGIKYILPISSCVPEIRAFERELSAKIRRNDKTKTGIQKNHSSFKYNFDIKLYKSF